MTRLRRAGISIATIAKLAGITTMGVRYRLQAKRKRKHKPYRAGSDGVRRAYLAKQRQRQRDYQEISLEHATNFGEWTPAELRYVEKHAAELTLLDLAIRLQRTYFSVSHFINRHGIEARK
jgi:hypothetical protein